LLHFLVIFAIFPFWLHAATKLQGSASF